ncbi:DUF6878 family protein [Ensifer sp. LCM 4579]|uniref:DUF6878 family protein n=1 Tax=Ensifer sp. LCM 4579 TaxID=1848292 RepID=UPI0008D94CD3|nr:DUF6878 family protein [Ensifer sp. LCM 4579]OHV80316.1 hypothetical protein LCM4579_22250 [Ensifer sp. LCM 4579]
MPAIALPDLDLSPDDVLSRYDANLREFRALSAQVRDQNRTALFEALTRANIAFVIVSFNRDDDEGRIDDLAVIGADRAAHLPENPISLPIALWGLPAPVLLDLSYPHAIERLAFDFIEQNHGSRCIAFTNLVNIIFNVAARSIAFAPRRGGKSNA